MDAAIQWPTSGNPQSIFVDDISGYRETLQLNSHLLFAGQDKINIEACILTGSGCTAKKLCTFKELQVFLDESEDSSKTCQDGCSPTACIFFLRQQSSRAAMAISEPAMMLLLSRLQVFPAFMNIINSFGAEKGPYTDGCSSFFAKISRDQSEASVFETAYMLKHVERHGRPDSVIPWSIRQMGVCQRYNIFTKVSSCVLIQTSQRVQNRIFELVENGNIMRFPYHWTFLHMIYLGTLSSQWTEYIKLLDSKIEEIDLEVRWAKLGSSRDRVTFEDLQQLNKLSDLVIRVIHALQLNLDILKMLSREAIKRAAIEGDELVEQYDEFQGALRTCTTGHAFLVQHASLVRDNAVRISTQLRDTIALQDSDATLTMTKKTVQEARTVTTITFVALIYLPASFVCTFLGMGFVHVESLSGVMHLSTSNDMWLFFAIAAPLMLVTFIGWWLWDLRNRRIRFKFESGEKYKDV